MNPGLRTDQEELTGTDLEPVRFSKGYTNRSEGLSKAKNKSVWTNLLLAVLHGVLVLGQFFVLLSFDPFGLVSEPVGVLLLQPLDGLLLLALQVLHLLVVLPLLTLRDRGAGLSPTRSRTSEVQVFLEGGGTHRGLLLKAAVDVLLLLLQLVAELLLRPLLLLLQEAQLPQLLPPARHNKKHVI